jgi:acetylornithine deacetylase/succinyl-diaminopimelate desuccinylase-like protein
MRHVRLAAVGLFLTLAAGLLVTIHAVDQGQKAAWEKVWNKKVDAQIRNLIRQVDSGRMSNNLFALAKDPLPYRKLNYTLPGHQKNTLYEADDYISGKLESWGYKVEREGVQVQAFRRDIRKPEHHQYASAMPEDPWYTAYNLYAVKRGRSHPDDIIVVVAHKDSQSWIDSPGANDNAIGTVSVMEMANVLRNYKSERTIRFLFVNEEHTPWTSVTAAQNAKKRGDRIVAVFNTDGVGVKTAEDNAAGKKTNLTMWSVPEGEWLAELMGAVNARYAIGLDQRSVKKPSINDDDGSFINAGYPNTVLNIGSWPYGDPNYHLPGDKPELSDVKNAAMAVQATLAAILTLDQER